MKTRLISSLIIIIFLTLSCTTYADDIPPIDFAKLASGERPLVVGHVANFPPFYLANYNAQGLDPDIVNEIAKRAGIKKITYLPFNTFEQLNQALEDGKIDMIVSDYWDIPSHRSRFLLTIPYYVRDGIAFIYSNQRFHFNSQNDLQNHKVGFFSHDNDIADYVKKYIQSPMVISYNSRAELLDALNENKIDAAFVYKTLYLYFLKDRKSLSIVLVKPINSVFAVRQQDTDLQARLNQVLKSSWSDWTLYKIKSKYLHPLGIEPAHNNWQKP